MSMLSRSRQRLLASRASVLALTGILSLDVKTVFLSEVLSKAHQPQTRPQLQQTRYSSEYSKLLLVIEQ